MQTLAICSLILMTFLTGCNTIYPISGEHIINVDADEEFTAPMDGYFLSDEYFKKILAARAKKF